MTMLPEMIQESRQNGSHGIIPIFRRLSTPGHHSKSLGMDNIQELFVPRPSLTRVFSASQTLKSITRQVDLSTGETSG